MNKLDDAEWETACPERADQKHCVCWYDGDPCCACGDPADSEAGTYDLGGEG
ncbi:MAG: hypothetical protein ACRDZ4_20995 [Egibacteraceae bacterium]